jgi:hypothetical protein
MRLEENPLLNPDFIDILSAFSEEGVEYLVVGGFAMAFHGYVRATGDIDLWIRISEENAKKVYRALQKFGAPLANLNVDDLQQPGMVYQMGVIPNRIDVMNQISAVQFDEAWENKTVFEFESLKIPVIGRQDLLSNKKATNTIKDGGDILWLENN